MSLSRKDRFKLKSQLLDAIAADEWSLERLNLLLNEFGLESLDGDWRGPSTADVIASISDADLVEMYALVLDVEVDEVEDVIESSDASNWKPGYVRVFLSHSAREKEFLSHVADELAVVGIHGFVAHDTLAYSKPWQAQIEQALRSMQAFVAFVHPEFNESAWCHHEVGWALGRRVPRYAVRLGADPAGFLASDQWPSCVGQTPKQVAERVSEWVASLPELGTTLLDGLLNALSAAGNYVDAGATAERIAALGSLSEENFRRLDNIWWGNDQLHGGVLPTRAMKPFYVSNGRTWPPPREQLTPASAILDEEPF